MRARDLVTGLPGHPSHPPLTDATIGLYTGATAFAVLSALGVAEENLAVAWWLALVAGLVVNAPTAATGVLDEPGRPAAQAAAPDAGEGRSGSAA